MPDRSTRERILEVSRELFNENGYAATPVSEIAARAGIATGNLTYHFATKRELAKELEKRARQQLREARTDLQTGAIASDYVEILRFGMNMTWENRFLFRDRTQFRSGTQARRERAVDHLLVLQCQPFGRQAQQGRTAAGNQGKNEIIRGEAAQHLENAPRCCLTGSVWHRVRSFDDLDAFAGHGVTIAGHHQPFERAIPVVLHRPGHGRGRLAGADHDCASLGR